MQNCKEIICPMLTGNTVIEQDGEELEEEDE